MFLLTSLTRVRGKCTMPFLANRLKKLIFYQKSKQNRPWGFGERQALTTDRDSFMAFMRWNNRFSVQIKEIDLQHRELLSLVNRLQDCPDEDNVFVLSRLVKDLKRYAYYHFQTEEKYMAHFGFPQLPQHIQKHQDFIEKISEISARVDDGKPVAVEDIKAFLKKWIIGHVMEEDLKIKEYLPQSPLAQFG